VKPQERQRHETRPQGSVRESPEGLRKAVGGRRREWNPGK
jgi:hypothetical protein